MSAPGLIADFRKWAATARPVYGELVILDPGGTCGLLSVAYGFGDDDRYDVTKCSLDALPRELHDRCSPNVRAVICEDFTLHAGRRNDPKMPASQGIGVARAVCYAEGLPLFLLQPNVKTEGYRHLDAAGLAAYAACRSDHERDVVDLAGKALYELRKAQR